jgi:hypothetical protein
MKSRSSVLPRSFLDTDGDDPEWPLWYAKYLEDRLAPFLAAPLTRSRLVFCLIGADDEHRAADPDAPWPEYYARRFLECLGPAEEPAKDQHAWSRRRASQHLRGAGLSEGAARRAGPNDGAGPEDHERRRRRPLDARVGRHRALPSGELRSSRCLTLLTSEAPWRRSRSTGSR